jgi:hypothetical protein
VRPRFPTSFQHTFHDSHAPFENNMHFRRWSMVVPCRFPPHTLKSNVDEETSVSRVTRHQVSYVNSLTLVLTVSLHLVSTKFVYTKGQLRVYTNVYTKVERRSTTFVMDFSTQLSRSCSYKSLPFFACTEGTIDWK